MISSYTGHHDDGAELEPFGEVHGANGDVAAGGCDLFIENVVRHARLIDGSSRTIELRR
jgi:hypothetical protein